MNDYETLTLLVGDLLPGDEFWGDEPFHFSEIGDLGFDADDDKFCAYRVSAYPVRSINTSLFGAAEDATCIVVAVEYADGARGSRLFSPGQRITVRRS